MKNQNMCIDLHCHPNLKPFNSGYPKPKYTMWEKIFHASDSRFAERIKTISHHILKESQCNLDSLDEGNVRVFNVSLYPIERSFLHMRNVPKWLIGKNKINIVQQVVTGFSLESIVHLKTHYDYFSDLQKEYRFVEDAIGKSSDKKKEFVLVNNFSELEDALKKANTLIGIMSIEGAHALGTGTPLSEKMSASALEKMLTENILKIKKWKYPPFTINLAHHFWNQLAGHATSFKPPINGLVNQNKGKDKGITPLGWHVIRQLLSKENGKRILIDTKHMSVASRIEYYQFIRNYNFVNPHDKIPIVSSHAGMNGYSTMESSIREKDVIRKARRSRLYKWSINISNEEIAIIHEAEGIIGLMMDRGNLGGVKTIKQISSIAEQKKQRMEYCKLFWENVFQIVKAVNEKSGWNVPAFGSDFDGTITHMDTYESSAKIPLFQQDLIDYLQTTQYKKELWYGYSPEVLVQKIMHENALQFYKKFFV
jgi:microsomal dipeptidase-like Zn-dependent dipeptidase